MYLYKILVFQWGFHTCLSGTSWLIWKVQQKATMKAETGWLVKQTRYHTKANCNNSIYIKYPDTSLKGLCEYYRKVRRWYPVVYGKDRRKNWQMQECQILSFVMSFAVSTKIKTHTAKTLCKLASLNWIYFWSADNGSERTFSPMTV